jgi:hypothetical protein
MNECWFLEAVMVTHLHADYTLDATELLEHQERQYMIEEHEATFWFITNLIAKIWWYMWNDGSFSERWDKESTLWRFWKRKYLKNYWCCGEVYSHAQHSQSHAMHWKGLELYMESLPTQRKMLNSPCKEMRPMEVMMETKVNVLFVVAKDIKWSIVGNMIPHKYLKRWYW